MKMMRRTCAGLALLALPQAAMAAADSGAAKAILMRSVAFRTVEGAGEVIRVSIGRETTAAEIDAFVAAWREIAA